MLPENKIFKLTDMIDYEAGQAVVKKAVDHENTKMFLIAIDNGTLPEHAAPLNAVVYAMEGNAVITCSGKDYPISAGESFTFKKGELHSVHSDGQYKMVLFLSADEL
ncbi:MAG: cupin domain-containing protein [Ileibacterium sp.]|nr:cupin domain-containing protein [Ileibacterium sp.]